jgi:hypothetical protein
MSALSETDVEKKDRHDPHRPCRSSKYRVIKVLASRCVEHEYGQPVNQPRIIVGLPI